jgi:hypothetical protein
MIPKRIRPYTRHGSGHRRCSARQAWIARKRLGRTPTKQGVRREVPR